MDTTSKPHARGFNKHHSKPHLKPFQAYPKSLLQKIAANRPTVSQDKPQSGKLIIAKLGDFVQNKCLFGANCAHLRAQAQCLFLHQKKDFQALGVPLPDKYLENQEPLKKSKQQRKQDKIKQKAERQKRLQQKQKQTQQKQKPQEPQQQLKEELPPKIVKQKIMDQKQLLVQKILKPNQSQQLTLAHIYEQLNILEDAICKNQTNTYTQQFNIPEMKLTLHQIRKRILTKFKKNKEYETLHKQMAEKEAGLVRKVIKNITGAYKEIVEEVTENDKWKNIDLRQIQQTFTTADVVQVLNLKKDNPEIIKYFERLFDEPMGHPVSFEPEQDEEVSINQGGLLPLRNFQLLPIISPNFSFSRLFLSLDISFSEIRSLSEFASLMIPHQITEKTAVQKTFTIDISSTSYSKFVDQMMSQFLADYHEKMKGPAKEFEFGKMQENLKKYRLFLSKYKAKVSLLNNTFILIVYNIKQFIEKIGALDLEEHLDYDKIKKDRSMEEEQTYERLFLLREFINIMSEGGDEKLRVIYVTPQKKFKPKNQKVIFGSIDKFLIEKQESIQQE